MVWGRAGANGKQRSRRLLSGLIISSAKGAQLVYSFSCVPPRACYGSMAPASYHLLFFTLAPFTITAQGVFYKLHCAGHSKIDLQVAALAPANALLIPLFVSPVISGGGSRFRSVDQIGMTLIFKDKESESLELPPHVRFTRSLHANLCLHMATRGIAAGVLPENSLA